MFIVQFPKTKTYLGHGELVKTKTAAKKFHNWHSACDCIDSVEKEFGEQGKYKVKYLFKSYTH